MVRPSFLFYYTREVPPVVEIFSDRLSVTSYGGLVQGLSQEEFFGGRSMPRNREIMRVYRDLDLVEQLGSGMNRILSAYPKDVFSISENFLEVSFPFEEGYVDSSTKLIDKPGKCRDKTEKTSGKRRDKTEKTSGKILDMCQENPSITIPEMAEQIGITERSIQRNIQKLQEQGSLRRLGSKKGGVWEVVTD